MKYFITIIMLLLMISCSKKENYTVTLNKNGVEVVRNLNRTMPNSKLKYNLEIVAELKNSEDKDYTLNFATYQSGRNFELGVTIDEDLNFYIIDYPTSTVLKISKDGKLLKKIGREGQGPGEFPNPPTVIDYYDGKLYVLDLSRRLNIFSKDGKLIEYKQMNLKNSRAYYGFKKMKGGSLVLNQRYDGSWGSSDFKSGFAITKTGNSLVKDKSNKVIYSNMKKFDLKNIDSEDFIAGMSTFNNNLALAEFSRNKFEINIYDFNKGLVRKIQKSYSSVVRDKETLKAIRKSLSSAEKKAGNMFKFKPAEKMKLAINNVFYDEQGNLLASINESTFNDDGQEFSIFDKKGIFRGNIKIPEFIGKDVINAGEYCIATTSIAANYLEKGKASPEVTIFKLNLSK